MNIGSSFWFGNCIRLSIFTLWNPDDSEVPTSLLLRYLLSGACLPQKGNSNSLKYVSCTTTCRSSQRKNEMHRVHPLKKGLCPRNGVATDLLSSLLNQATWGASAWLLASAEGAVETRLLVVLPAIWMHPFSPPKPTSK